MLINAGINVSKIKKEAVNIAEKTGDKWINVTIRLHSEDKFGNICSIKQWTGDKEEHLYLGNGKVAVFKDDYPKENSGNGDVLDDDDPINDSKENEDDLPF